MYPEKTGRNPGALAHFSLQPQPLFRKPVSKENNSKIHGLLGQRENEAPPQAEVWTGPGKFQRDGSPCNYCSIPVAHRREG